MKLIYILSILSMCFILVSCNEEKKDFLNIDESAAIDEFTKMDESINIEEEIIPSAIILNDEELELKEEIIEDVKKEIENNPYDEYDKYISKENNISIDEAKQVRELNGLMIAISTTDNYMEITSFDDYIQIAMLYFVNLGGHAKDIFDNCKNEDDVKNYLINKDGMGNLNFSSIINEHKFNN